MAKKRISRPKTKPLRRTSTMLKVVAEGEKFLAETKKKKPTRTRTMAQTIKEAQEMMSRKPKKQSKREQSRSESLQSEAQNKGKKQKKITKSKVSKKVASNKGSDSKPTSSTRKTSKEDTSKKRGSKQSISTPPAIPDNLKKTVFKTKSKNNLPLPAFGFIDVCFCIDATGSMSGELARAQSTIHSIIKNIENKVQTEGLTLRFAVVSYRDHPPQDHTYVTKILDFTGGHEAGQYVNSLEAWGGGDFPEAVHDGLMDCCTKLSWVELPGTPILRYIFHIADAPPHGKQFGNTNEAKQGCLCGMRISHVYHEINLRQIHYRLIKARSGSALVQMQEHFKRHIIDFKSVELSDAKQMDVKVSDMIIHEMVPVHA